MERITSHLVFNKQQRSGMLFLVLLITALLGVYHFYDFSEDPVFDVSSSEVKALQKQIDSLRLIEFEARKPKQYPFNPNYITDYKAYTLGISPQEYDRLKEFRSKDKWINSTADFKRVTKVSDSLLGVISPYFKFPEWVTNPKPRKKGYTNFQTTKQYTQKIDLNAASGIQLQEVHGIGKTLSKRIVNYRKKIGGFSSDLQLYNIWGLDETTINNASKLFTVRTPKRVEKMDVNTASASDIATIPGISFDLAKVIWEFKELRGRIDSISELEKIESLTNNKLQLIQLYLSVED